MASRTCRRLVTAISVLASVCIGEAGAQPARGSVPVIYCTDLFHPPDDPDDWFDLATVFSMEEFDIRAIVLDQGEKQLRRSGRIPIEQMMVITGRKARSAYGLSRRLESPSDKGLDQPQKYQGGVELIIAALRSSERKVTVIAVGSLRDVCAAFNRQPELLRAKVGRLYVVAGHSNGGKEYNVQLDPHAYVGVMRSRLPIYWLPCFGRGPHVSRWTFRQSEVLESCSLQVQNYLAYGLTKADPTKVDALLALDQPISGGIKEKIWAMDRAMWSTAAFIHAAHRAMEKHDKQWRAVPSGQGEPPNPVFRFVPAKVTLGDTGVTRFADIEINSSTPNLHLFRFEGNVTAYNEAMRDALVGLLRQLGH